MWRRWVTALVALVALAPVTTGATPPGLYLEGPLRLPTGATIEGDVLAVLQQDPEGLREGMLTADYLEIAFREIEVVRVAPTPATPSIEIVPPRSFSASWEVHNANVFLQAARDGFVGIYPTDGAASTVAFSPNVSVVARDATTFASGGGHALDDGPHRPWYYQPVVGQHLYAQSPAVFAYDGPGAFKVMGSTVTIVARENTTTYETGVWKTETSYIERWLYFSFGQGSVRLDSAAPVEVAFAPNTQVEWSGEAGFRAVGGSLQLGSQELRPAGGAAQLTGDLHATLGVVTSEGTTRLVMTNVDGELAHTNLAVTRSSGARIAATDASTWILPLLGLAAVLGGAAHLVLRQARTDRRESVAKGKWRAPEPVEHLDWDTAVARAAAARRDAPHDPTAVLEHAYCLLYRGDFDLAVAAFDEAAALSATGEPDLRAAVALAQRGYQLEALGHLERALARQPALAEEALTEPGLDELLTRNERAKAILQQALDRMRDGWNAN